ncbi:hypothetical protein MPLA_1820008 [Mesorhizobium sp. ORS 3359]|nr:hypothetical protein MPLA_1820008 [Mesorhizobium sp. ORS 3359]
MPAGPSKSWISRTTLEDPAPFRHTDGKAGDALTKGKHGSNLSLELLAPLSGLHPSHAGPHELRLLGRLQSRTGYPETFRLPVTGPPTDRRSGILHGST